MNRAAEALALLLVLVVVEEDELEALAWVAVDFTEESDPPQAASPRAMMAVTIINNGAPTRTANLPLV